MDRASGKTTEWHMDFVLDMIKEDPPDFPMLMALGEDGVLKCSPIEHLDQRQRAWVNIAITASVGFFDDAVIAASVMPIYVHHHEDGVHERYDAIGLVTVGLTGKPRMMTLSDPTGDRPLPEDKYRDDEAEMTGSTVLALAWALGRKVPKLTVQDAVIMNFLQRSSKGPTTPTLEEALSRIELVWKEVDAYAPMFVGMEDQARADYHKRRAVLKFFGIDLDIVDDFNVPEELTIACEMATSWGVSMDLSKVDPNGDLARFTEYEDVNAFMAKIGSPAGGWE